MTRTKLAGLLKYIANAVMNDEWSNFFEMHLNKEKKANVEWRTSLRFYLT